MRAAKKEKRDKYTSNMGTLKDIQKTKQEQEWLKENKEDIDKQNKRIEKYGCFSDGIRRF